MKTLMQVSLNEDTTTETPKTFNEMLMGQTAKHASRTEKYSVVTSLDVVKMFNDAGAKMDPAVQYNWQVIAKENSTAKYRNFGTHLFKLEQIEDTDELGDQELDKQWKPQLLIKNSYHGRTKLEMHYGLQQRTTRRYLILGHKVKVKTQKHIHLQPGDVDEIVAEMSRTMRAEVVALLGHLKTRVLSIEEQNEFAKDVLAERFRDNPNFLDGDHQLLLSNRDLSEGINGNSAWDVLQRVQANLGLNFGEVPVEMYYNVQATDNKGKEIIRKRKMKALSKLATVTYLNQYLFDRMSDYLPEEAQLKKD